MDDEGGGRLARWKARMQARYRENRLRMRYPKSAAEYDALYRKPARDVKSAYLNRVTATRGLIANGADAVPYAARMLRSADPDEREHGAVVLGEIARRHPALVHDLVVALAMESDWTVRDALIVALGQLRAREAIPLLAWFIRDPDADGDTADVAAHSLGRIVRARFDRSGHPVQAARAWLEAHPID